MKDFDLARPAALQRTSIPVRVEALDQGTIFPAGPADLGRNHDKYLTYADREEAGGAASA